MVSHADAVWFGNADAFLANGSPTEQVCFPKRRKWQRYVDARRLEITCGEAPFLVNRYDAYTGEVIPQEKRQGILDRKLRVVGENAATEAEWFRWTLRAFQSTYGFEFQGDNLLIARVNLLMTFEEALWARWQRKPTAGEYRQIIRAIVWNVWQMDGLTGKIPYCNADAFHQLSLYEWLGSEAYQGHRDQQPHCRIADWRRKRSLEYLEVNKGGRNMKFDFVIGNPPYQEETTGDNKGFAPPIYNKFLDAAYQISDKVEMIHPARFLFNAGSTPKEWNQKMLNDPHLKILMFEQQSAKIFANTDIKGGVVITYRDSRKDFGRIEVFTPYEELNSLRMKAAADCEDNSISKIIYTQVRFNLDVLYKDFPELKGIIGSDGKDKRFRNNIFDRIPLFTDTPSDNSIKVLGISKNKRVWRYIPVKYVDKSHENLCKWKVLVPRANGSGAIGEILSTPLISTPFIGYTQSFIGIGSFDTEAEANACYKYIKSKLARALLGILKITQDNDRNVWRMIPLQDFTPASDIDWSQSIPDIDRQLYKKYNLDDAEVEFIETHVKEMA